MKPRDRSRLAPAPGPKRPRWTFATWILAGLAGLMGVATLLAACGGGVGSGGTGGYAAGPITGFGSVIVNEVHFDDSLATVVDGDGAARTRDDLRMGMTVEVDSGAITATLEGQAASASRIEFDSALRGPLASVDKAGGGFALLGQQVVVDANTVFDERLASGLDGLAPGRLVEVYAVFNPATARFRATRVEPASAAAGLQVRGPVTQIDGTARSLQIGATAYGFGSATGVPADLAVGQFVRLRLVASGSSRWAVQAFGQAPRSPPDADEAKLKGLISAFTSATRFSVNGRPVDAGTASFPDGQAGLALGVRVEVEGSLRGGVLRATRVEIQSDDDERNRGFELRGPIAALASDLSSFVVRGQTVSTLRPGLVYANGKVSDLKLGAQVRVKGVLAADGQRIEATRIEFRD